MTRKEPDLMASQSLVTAPEQDQYVEGGVPTCPYHATSKLLDLSNPHFHDTSLATFAELRAQCPVARVTFHDGTEDERPRGPFQRDAFLVTRYDDGNAALLDGRIGVDPQRAMTEEQLAQLPEPPSVVRLFRRNLLGVDPPDHTRLRKLVQPSFTNKQMEALRPRIQAIVDHLLDRVEAAAAARGETAPNRTMELIEAFSFPMPIQVICDMLGIPSEDQADVRRWFLALPIGEGTARSEEEIQAIVREFAEYLETLFERRRREPGSDLISDLVHAEEEGDRPDGQGP